MIHATDLPRWQAKLDQIEAAVATDAAVIEGWTRDDAVRPQRDSEMRAILAELQQTGDFANFRKEVDLWSRKPGPYTAFSGFGQMWLNQVANNIPDGDNEILRVLTASLSTPISVDDSLEKMSAVQAATENLASKGQPAAGRIPYVLSLFWATDDVTPSWPVMWKSAPERMYDLGWLRTWGNLERWPDYLEAARTLRPQHVARFDRLMWYLTEHRFVGLNPALEGMCEEAAELMQLHRRGVGYPDDTTAARAESLAHQLKGELALAGVGLVEQLSDRTGLTLSSAKIDPRIAFEKTGAFRADAYAIWTAEDKAYAPSLRLWATRSGVAFGVHTYGGGDTSDAADMAATIAPHLPADVTFFKIQPHLSGDRLEPVEGHQTGEVFAGRWWTWEDVPQGLDLQTAVLDAGEAFAPAAQAVLAPSGPSVTPPPSDDSLVDLVERFRSERPYPNEKDEWHHEERAKFAEAFSAENLVVFDLDRFRLLSNGPRYGGPGPQSVLNASLSAMDSIALDEFAHRLHDILWGDDPTERRIDRALDWNDLGTKGLGESVVMKLFAVTDPDRFLPIFPLTGPHGKIAMLRRFSLPEPDTSLGRGEQHIQANDTIRERLEPLFPGDPWGQAQFAYWVLQGDTSLPPEIDLLGKTADELLVSESFLQDLKELLLEKGQIVFYGPPGTGKTYIADKFAAAIQPDPDRRMVVQFHPSMSYEDFFEGYRPLTDDGGQMSYQLRKGPLALMADKAEAAPGVPHVLIIDEINRANLPRVFGELLYLLEYRKKWVRTAYRADEPFELPANLYFIGTMNTADRSIAIIDAALRRRFHFIPFVPHEGEMAGVLKRWLSANDEPAWLATLVDKVNEELRSLLKGTHLLIGHSHFMIDSAGKGSPTALTDKRLRRIWNYGIYPFIEDQLHGKPDQLQRFTWDAVLKRYGPDSEPAAEVADTAGNEDDVDA